MNTNHILVGLDVGTTKVCTIVGRVDQKTHQLEILGIGLGPSEGLKKGSVVHIDRTIESIKSSIDEAKLMSGVEIISVYAGVAGGHVYSFNNSGVVSIKSMEIGHEDIERAIDAAKAVVIPSDREILHVLPQEFIVDNTRGIKNPLGMVAKRLEVKVHIVTGNISTIQNLVKCIEASGVMVNDIILQPLASSDSVLTKEEKDLGVVLVDIGGGTTDIAVWKEGGIVHSQIIPVGGQHFTNDLAVALKISHEEAERVKIDYGNVLLENIHQQEHVTVKGLSGTRPREIDLALITKVLEARSVELFELIKDILVERNLVDGILGGIVLTGGGSMIRGLSIQAEYLLEFPAKLGHPRPIGGMTNLMQNPKYSTAIGLLLEAYKKGPTGEGMAKSPDIVKKLSESLKNAFKEIF